MFSCTSRCFLAYFLFFCSVFFVLFFVLFFFILFCFIENIRLLRLLSEMKYRQSTGICQLTSRPKRHGRCSTGGRHLLCWRRAHVDRILRRSPGKSASRRWISVAYTRCREFFASFPGLQQLSLRFISAGGLHLFDVWRALLSDFSALAVIGVIWHRRNWNTTTLVVSSLTRWEKGLVDRRPSKYCKGRGLSLHHRRLGLAFAA